MFLRFAFCLLFLRLVTANDTDCVSGVDPETSPGLTADFNASAWSEMWRLVSDDDIEENDSRQETNKLDDSLLEDASILAAAGVQYMYLDPSGYAYPESQIPWEPNATNNDLDPLLAELREDRNFSYADIITVTSRVDSFWNEHFHEFDTIRYIVNGSGYFDLRDVNDEWVRFSVKTGDLFFWPGGIYHRFTVDDGNFITAMRLFQGSPVWSSYVRNETKGNNSARMSYIDTYLCGGDPDAVEEFGDNTDEVEESASSFRGLSFVAISTAVVFAVIA